MSNPIRFTPLETEILENLLNRMTWHQTRGRCGFKDVKAFEDATGAILEKLQGTWVPPSLDTF